MNLENLFLLVSMIFFLVYIIRYKDKLIKRICILTIASLLIYVLVYLLLLQKNDFNIYLISKSILIFIALDQLYFYTFSNKKKANF